MVRRNEIFGISIVAIVCLLLIGFSQKDLSNYHRSHRYQQIELEESLRYNNNYSVPIPSIEDVISLQKTLIYRELNRYQFPAGDSLEDYTMSTGGKPVRTVVITTWRSGSTFLGKVYFYIKPLICNENVERKFLIYCALELYSNFQFPGDILNAVPGTFYHYEPLLEYDIVRIRGPPNAEPAVNTLKSLLKCNYSDLQSYLQYGMSHVYLFTHNTRLWDQCEQYPGYCWNSNFLNQFCKLFPFQSMKSVRLNLEVAEDLLEDKR